MASSAGNSDTESTSSWTTCSPFDGIEERKSPALPPEILMKIFRLAIDSCHFHLDSLRLRLETKLACAQVCRNWWIASEVGLEYIVQDTKQAVGLIAWLQKTKRGTEVRSLELSWQDGKRRGRQLGRLIDLCPNIVEIKFEAHNTGHPTDYLGSRKEYDLLGYHVRNSLSRLKVLSLLSLEGNGLQIACGFPICSLNRHIPITKITFTGIVEPQNLGDYLPMPFTLTHLTWEVDEILPLLISLSVSTCPSLVSLNLGTPIDTPCTAILSWLLPLAPKLRKLELLDGLWNSHQFLDEFMSHDKILLPSFTEPFNRLIEALQDIEVLSLGTGSIQFPDITSSLETLPRLHTLSIDMNEHSLTGHLFWFGGKEIIKLLQATKLRSLILPERILKSWSLLESREADKVAEEREVVVEWFGMESESD